MGLRGPAPKPTNLRLLEGNPSGKPINRHEPQPQQLAHADPPLRFNEGKKQIWNKLIAMLSRIGLFTEADYNIAYRYVDLLWEYERAMGTAQELANILISKDKDGKVTGWQPSPPLALARKLDKDLRWFEGQFGLTPAARSSLTVVSAASQPLLPEDNLNVPTRQTKDPFRLGRPGRPA